MEKSMSVNKLVAIGEYGIVAVGKSLEEVKANALQTLAQVEELDVSEVNLNEVTIYPCTDELYEKSLKDVSGYDLIDGVMHVAPM